MNFFQKGVESLLFEKPNNVVNTFKVAATEEPKHTFIHPLGGFLLETLDVLPLPALELEKRLCADEKTHTLPLEISELFVVLVCAHDCLSGLVALALLFGREEFEGAFKSLQFGTRMLGDEVS